MFLMNNPGTLAALGTSLYGRSAAGLRIRTPRMPKPASDQEVSDLLQSLYWYQRDNEGKVITEEAIERAVLSKFVENMSGSSRRILEDILKRPYALDK